MHRRSEQGWLEVISGPMFSLAVVNGMTVPVVISVYKDKSFTFEVKSPPAAVLIKEAAGIEKGSGVPNKEKVGTITTEQVRGTLKGYPGSCDAYLHLIRRDHSETIIALPEALKVRPSEELLEAIERLFGTGVAFLQ